MFALAKGVPIIAAEATEDKPEIGNRIAYSGVGIRLNTSTPTPEQVNGAVSRVLSEPAFRMRAEDIQRELAKHDAPSEAADPLECVTITKEPVLRR